MLKKFECFNLFFSVTPLATITPHQLLVNGLELILERLKTLLLSVIKYYFGNAKEDKFDFLDVLVCVVGFGIVKYCKCLITLYQILSQQILSYQYHK